MERSQQKYNEFSSGKIVKIKNLKAEKRTNNLIVLQRARIMSHSFGIVMAPPIKINTKNATEIRVKWIGNDSIALGINPRYLRAFPQLIIHVLPHNEENIISFMHLFSSLDQSFDGNVYPIPYDASSKQFLVSDLRAHHPCIPSDSSLDVAITFDILCAWILGKESNETSSNNVHVINQESTNSDFLSMSSIIKTAKYLPTTFPISKLFDKGIVYKSWIKTNIPTSPNAVLAMNTKLSYDEIVQVQLRYYKEQTNANMDAKSNNKLPSFVIHQQPPSDRAGQAIIETLAKDSKNIVLLWPSSENVGARHKNVFYQNTLSKALYNSTMNDCLENFDSNEFVFDTDRLAETLFHIFSVTPEHIMVKAMNSMRELCLDSSYFQERLRQMNKMTNCSSINDIKRVIDVFYYTEHWSFVGKQRQMKQLGFKKWNFSFWRQFSIVLKQAILRMSSIRSQDKLNNAMAFEAITFWEVMRIELDGSYKLHIISPNDNVFNRRNLRRLGSFWMTPALKSVFK